MSLRNTRSEYGVVSWTLHWIIVAAIVGQWLLAEAGEDASTVASAFNPLMLHQSIGLLVLALATFRLIWKLANPKPAWPADMTVYEIRIARIVHIAFYALLFAIPLTGWALSSVEEEPFRFFNWFDVPRVQIAGEDTLEELHEALFNVLVGLAVLHVLGAVKHWFVRWRGGHKPAAV